MKAFIYLFLLLLCMYSFTMDNKQNLSQKTEESSLLEQLKNENSTWLNNKNKRYFKICGVIAALAVTNVLTSVVTYYLTHHSDQSLCQMSQSDKNLLNIMYNCLNFSESSDCIATCYPRFSEATFFMYDCQNNEYN